MICFSSLLLKIIPLLAMSVAAYTDAVMLFVGSSHYWLNILIYRSCALRGIRSPKRGPLALSRNACPNSILGGQM